MPRVSHLSPSLRDTLALMIFGNGNSIGAEMFLVKSDQIRTIWSTGWSDKAPMTPELRQYDLLQGCHHDHVVYAKVNASIVKNTDL